MKPIGPRWTVAIVHLDSTLPDEVDPGRYWRRETAENLAAYCNNISDDTWRRMGHDGPRPVQWEARRVDPRETVPVNLIAVLVAFLIAVAVVTYWYTR